MRYCQFLFKNCLQEFEFFENIFCLTAKNNAWARVTAAIGLEPLLSNQKLCVWGLRQSSINQFTIIILFFEFNPENWSIIQIEALLKCSSERISNLVDYTTRTNVGHSRISYEEPNRIQNFYFIVSSVKPIWPVKTYLLTLFPWIQEINSLAEKMSSFDVRLSVLGLSTEILAWGDKISILSLI